MPFDAFLGKPLIRKALQAGEESVARGPELLHVLREAGVVDAGGYGLTVMLAGIVGALRGSEVEVPPVVEKKPSPSAGEKPFAHPFFWAAFILVGDPE